MKNRKKGFTLVELIVTIALLAIIGTIIAVNIVGLTRQQQAKEKIRIESALKAAVEAYVKVNNLTNGCIKIDDLINENYIKESEVSDYKGQYILVSVKSGNTTYDIVSACADAPLATKKEFKVTYNKNLENEEVNNMPVDENKYQVGDDHIILNTEKPTTFGYIFKYWSYSKNGVGVKQPLKMTNNGINLYAIWEPKDFTLSYDTSGGEPSPSSQKGKYKTDVTITAQNPSKAGYTFKNWQNGNKQYIKGDKVYLDNNITLKATYEPNVYEITLNQQEGIDGTTKIYEQYKTNICSDKSCSETISSIIIPKKIGYNFQGYFTQANGQGNKYIDKNGKIIMNNDVVLQNTTLYAHWTKIEHNITINVGNGTKKEPILSKVKYQESGEQEFIPKEGYGLDTSRGGKLTCSGLASYNYDNNNNTLKLSNVTGDVSCNINFVETDHVVTLKVKDGSIGGLYDSIRNSSTIFTKEINNEHAPEPNISIYDYKSESLTVNQFIQDAGLKSGDRVDTHYLVSSGGYETSSVKVYQDTGSFQIMLGSPQCVFTVENSNLVRTSGYEKCNKFYTTTSKGNDTNILYKINWHSSSNTVKNVTKYQIVDVMSDESGLYKSSSDDSYFFRGKIENNYVNFAGRKWRVIGLNKDKSIRLIADFNIGAVKYNTTDNKFDNLKYFGYTYDNSAVNVQDGTKSTIKKYLDDWYNKNLKEYDNYIVPSEFINLTTTHRTEGSSSNRRYYYSKDYIWPEGTTRWGMSYYDLTDKFNLNYGGLYKEKIGLMSAKEISNSGFLNGEISKNTGLNSLLEHFLQKDYTWWTMSPSYARENRTYNRDLKKYDYSYDMTVMTVDNNGIKESDIMADNVYVRPVISLKAGSQATGRGTKSDPYNIIMSEINNTFKVNLNEKYTFSYPIIPSYGYDFSNISCTNNQTKNANYNETTGKFSIAPTNNTVCTIEFKNPYLYKINLWYPSKFADPTISMNGGKYKYNKSNDKTASIDLRVVDPANYKLNIRINNYEYNGLQTSSLDNMSTSCSGYDVSNNTISFNGFDTSLNNGSCGFTIYSTSSGGDSGDDGDDSNCTLVCGGGSFDEDGDSNQDDCWWEC